eukprot:6214205-Pleurochrysis_carterae.AAC.3
MLEDGSDAAEDTRSTIEIICAHALCTADEAKGWFKSATYRRREHGLVNIYHAPATGADARVLLGTGPRGGVGPSVGECLSMVNFDELRQCAHDGCKVLALGKKLQVAGQVRSAMVKHRKTCNELSCCRGEYSTHHRIQNLAFVPG